MRIESYADRALSELYPPFPGVRANFVTSLDGAVEVGGVSAGLSGEADKRVFRLLRMVCDALMVGAGTFRAENYKPLTLDPQRRAWRDERGLSRYPRMVVVSKSLDLDPGHPALAGAIVLTTGVAGVDVALARVAEIVPCDDLAHGLELLRGRGFRHVLCEGGPGLLGELTRLDLVDEVCLTVSPLLAGPGSGRIIAGAPHPARGMRIEHVLTADDGTVLMRHVRSGPRQAT
ncbi:MAG TPA: pyrimidine reductase family protein [Candidatus Limnocylindrales bacterium]